MAETGDTKVEIAAEENVKEAVEIKDNMEKQEENVQKQQENTEKQQESTEKQPESTEQQSNTEQQSENNDVSDSKKNRKEPKDCFYMDKLTPEQRTERTLRIVDEILARKNSESAHVHHRTIEARGMYRKQRDITRDLQNMRDDFLNMEVEVNDMKRKMMLRRQAPSGCWRADKFIYDHPRLKYSLEDFNLR